MEKPLPQQHSLADKVSAQSWGLCSASVHSASRLKTQLLIHRQQSPCRGPETGLLLTLTALTEGYTRSHGSRCSFHPALHRQDEAVMATYKRASCTAPEKEACYLEATDYLGKDTFQDCLEGQRQLCYDKQRPVHQPPAS